MSCGFCIDCTEGPEYRGADCPFIKLLPSTDLTSRWHGYPVSCTDDACLICDCDCNHCCFGLGPACEETPDVVKTCYFPTEDGKLGMVLKMKFNTSRKELGYLDVLFRLAQSPENNLEEMVAIVSEFPQFEFMSDDSGQTIVDEIRKHPAAESILSELYLGMFIDS